MPETIRGSQTILLVDDDEQALGMSKYVLESAAWVVQTAQNGPEALAATRQVNPHLIVVDLLMPGMDGGEVLRRLRADDRTKRIPVMAITGVPEWLQGHRDVVAEFDDIVLKPVTADAFVGSVDRAISRWVDQVGSPG